MKRVRVVVMLAISTLSSLLLLDVRAEAIALQGVVAVCDKRNAVTAKAVDDQSLDHTVARRDEQTV